MPDPSVWQPKLLIVDDEEYVVELLGRILRGAGYQNIESTTDPRSAVRLLGEFQPDLVVLDLLMPRLSGLEVLAQLRAIIPAETHLPILVVTADPTIETRRAALGRGATDFVTKPYDSTEILARVGNLLETRLLHLQLAAQNAELMREAAQRRAAETALQLESDDLRDSERRYRHLIHALPAAVYVCDPEGRITLYNEAAVELWGREPELGKDFWCGSRKIFRTDGSPLPVAECPMAITLREGRSVRGEEIIIERPDGSRRFVLPYPDPMRDASGALVGAVNMLVDNTERRRAEAARDEFFSRVSHELRTPLHAILGFAQLLDVNGQSAEDADNVAQILNAAHHLLKLVDELLDCRVARPAG